MKAKVLVFLILGFILVGGVIGTNYLSSLGNLLGFTIITNLNATKASIGQTNVTDLIARGPFVDVRAFGAKGDHSIDDSAAIQAAASHAEANKIGTVLIPCGNYSLRNTITIPCDYPIVLQGQGLCSVLELEGGMKDGIILGKPSANSYGCRIDKLYIRGKSTYIYDMSNNTRWSVTINNMHFGAITNSKIQYGKGGGIRILANGTGQISVMNTIDNTYVGEFVMGKGIRIDTLGPGDGDTPWNNYNTITNSWINKNLFSVYLLKGNNSCGTLSANKFLNDYIETRYNKSATAIWTQGSDQTSFINCNLDVLADGIAIRSSSSYSLGEYFDVNMERGNISQLGRYSTIFKHDRYNSYLYNRRSLAIKGALNVSSIISNKTNVSFFNSVYNNRTDTQEGHRLQIYRVAPSEGTSSLDLYVDNSRNGVINANGTSLYLFSNSSGSVSVRSNDFYVGGASGNYKIGLFGLITAAGGQRSVMHRIEDTQDSYILTRQDSTIKDMNVTFPLAIAESPCRGDCVRGSISFNTTLQKGCICISTNTYYNFSLTRP